MRSKQRTISRSFLVVFLIVPLLHISNVVRVNKEHPKGTPSTPRPPQEQDYHPKASNISLINSSATATPTAQVNHVVDLTPAPAEAQEKASLLPNASLAPEPKPPSPKPYFILHLGPAKTGTTTIQCSLQAMAQEGILARDNYTVLETQSCKPNILYHKSRIRKQGLPPAWQATYDNVKNGIAFMPKCIEEWTPPSSNISSGNNTPSCWTESYGKYIQDEILPKNHSIVVSLETMGRALRGLTLHRHLFVQDFMKALSDYQIVVVVVYRHWFEFIASRYQQTLSNLGARPKLNSWPSMGGSPTETMVQHVERILNDLDYVGRERDRLYYDFLDTFEGIFQNVSGIDFSILNFHSGHLETDFFCHSMVGATSVCSHVQLSQGDNDKQHYRNIGSNFQWFDDLAVEAQNRGLLSSSHQRAQVGKYAAYKYKMSVISKEALPLVTICPSTKFMDGVYNISLAMMKKVLPSHQHVSMEEHHRLTFDKALEEKKFCRLNAIQTLDHPRWNETFALVPRNLDGFLKGEEK